MGGPSRAIAARDEARQREPGMELRPVPAHDLGDAYRHPSHGDSAPSGLGATRRATVLELTQAAEDRLRTCERVGLQLWSRRRDEDDQAVLLDLGGVGDAVRALEQRRARARSSGVYADRRVTSREFRGGRCRTRTDDLFRVKEARYQLRQSPASRTGLNDRTGCREVLRTIWRDTRGPHLVLRTRSDRVMSYECSGQAPGTKCGCSAVGSAQPCQGWGREFESRHPLEWRGLRLKYRRRITTRGSNHITVAWPSG